MGQQLASCQGLLRTYWRQQAEMQQQEMCVGEPVLV